MIKAYYGAGETHRSRHRVTGIYRQTQRETRDLLLFWRIYFFFVFHLCYKATEGLTCLGRLLPHPFCRESELTVRDEKAHNEGCRRWFFRWLNCYTANRLHQLDRFRLAFGRTIVDHKLGWYVVGSHAFAKTLSNTRKPFSIPDSLNTIHFTIVHGTVRS